MGHASLSLEETERNTIGVSSTSRGVDCVAMRLLKACWVHTYTIQCERYIKDASPSPISLRNGSWRK